MTRSLACPTLLLSVLVGMAAAGCDEDPPDELDASAQDSGAFAPDADPGDGGVEPMTDAGTARDARPPGDDAGEHTGNRFYIATDGSDSNPGTEPEPFGTFAHAFTVMSGGDTLVVKAGEYLRNVIVDPPSGTEANPTMILAEVDGTVTIDDEHASTAGYPGAVLSINSSYVRIQGITFRNGGSVVGAIDSDAHHVFIKRCGFIGADASETYAVVFRNSGSYSLLEDCWFAGGGRYLISDGYGRYSVYRRCVGRWDYSRGNQPIGGFMNYHEQAVGGGTSAAYQNCIVVDFNDPIGHDTWLTGGFADKFGHNITRAGCIAMNILSSSETGRDARNPGQRMTGFFDEPSDGDGRSGVNVFTDCVSIGAFRGYAQVRRGTSHIENFTIIDSSAGGVSWGASSPSPSFRNSLFVNNGEAASTTADYSYCHFQGETVRGDNTSTGEAGLLYPLQIETSSVCRGSGELGVNRGATVLHRIGRDGTFQGDTGWNEVTETSLWPFPNEELIKRDFLSVPPPRGGAIPTTSDSSRGFCASGLGLYGGPITLTSHIWEALGNPCPADICR